MPMPVIAAVTGRIRLAISWAMWRTRRDGGSAAKAASNDVENRSWASRSRGTRVSPTAPAEWYMSVHISPATRLPAGLFRGTPQASSPRRRFSMKAVAIEAYSAS